MRSVFSPRRLSLISYPYASPAEISRDTYRSPSVTEKEVREVVSRRAYAIWEGEGRPEQCDLSHWLQAETEVLQQAREPTTA